MTEDNWRLNYTGNPFDWLEYSANLSDNSRSYIVGEVLQLFPVNAVTDHEMLLEWNGVEHNIGIE